MTVRPRTGISIVSNEAYQDKPQMKKWCIKFRLAGFFFDRKEVFIILRRHLGSAGIGVNLKTTCQERARQLCSLSGPPLRLAWRK